MSIQTIRTQHWHIRDVSGGDLPFIYSTWLNSYRADSYIGRSCRTSIFYKEYSRVIDRILGSPETVVDIAHTEDDPKVILGYGVFAPGTLHYLFVKEPFRRMGIARSLCRDKGVKLYTHRTLTATPISADHTEADYDPFILYRTDQTQGEDHGKTSQSSS